VEGSAANSIRVKDSLGTASQVDLGHVPKVLREPMRGFHDIYKNNLSLDIVKVEFNLNGFHNNAADISDFRSEDVSIVELNAVSPVDILFSYGRCIDVQTFQN
jgi:hypothetical protein